MMMNNKNQSPLLNNFPSQGQTPDYDKLLRD